MSKKQKEASEVEVDYAYGVLDGVVEGMNKVADNPNNQLAFTMSFFKNLPQIMDAIEVIVKPEHRPKLAGVVRSSAKMMEAVIKCQAK